MNWELSVTLYLCLGYTWTYYTLWYLDQVAQGKKKDDKVAKEQAKMKKFVAEGKYSQKMVEVATTITGVLTVFLWPISVAYFTFDKIRSRT